MLSFVGLGLYDEHSITQKGAATIAAADDVFAEFYTSRLMGTTIDTLEATHETTIDVRDRAGVEEDPEPILTAAAEGHAAFLTAGDPMIATTHVDLRLRAADRGIDTEIVHGTTAQAAASSLTGLQNYRFGPATTLPFPEAHGDGDVPGSVYETIDANLDRDLHTMVFLDIVAPEQRYLTVDQAATLLADRYGDRLGVGIARAGSDEPRVVATSLETLAEMDIGEPLHLLVLPGSRHPLEAKALATFAEGDRN